MNANPGQQPEPPVTSSMATKVYTTREACEVLSIGKTFLFDLIRCGQLRSFKTRHKRYVSATAINEYIQARESLERTFQGF
jgi:excisionase family DNA binding protein